MSKHDIGDVSLADLIEMARNAGLGDLADALESDDDSGVREQALVDEGVRQASERTGMPAEEIRCQIEEMGRIVKPVMDRLSENTEELANQVFNIVGFVMTHSSPASKLSEERVSLWAGEYINHLVQTGRVRDLTRENMIIVTEHMAVGVMRWAITLLLTGKILKGEIR